MIHRENNEFAYHSLTPHDAVFLNICNEEKKLVGTCDRIFRGPPPPPWQSSLTIGNIHFSVNEERLGIVYRYSIHGFSHGGALRMVHQEKLNSKDSLYICSKGESLGRGQPGGEAGLGPTESSLLYQIHRRNFPDPRKFICAPVRFSSLNESQWDCVIWATGSGPPGGRFYPWGPSW